MSEPIPPEPPRTASAAELRAVTEQGLLERLRGLAKALGGLAVALGALVGLFASVTGGAVWVLSEARAQSAPAIEGIRSDAGRIERKADFIADDLVAHKRDEAQRMGEVRSMLEEQRKDLRALYSTVRTGRRSARLEDGGP